MRCVSTAEVFFHEGAVAAMTTTCNDDAGRKIESSNSWPDEEMIELSFFLPGWQSAELERAARYQGLTLAQLIRRLISDYLANGPH
jgi:hypothetical protein